MTVATTEFGTRVTKVYRLPTDLIEGLDSFPINRSAAIAIAINEAHKDPMKLARALEKRVAFDLAAEIPWKSVTTTLDPKVVKNLEALSKRARMETENVLRLAIEAFVLRL